MIFYAKKNTQRLQYICKHILSYILGIDCTFTDNLPLFLSSNEKVKILYGENPDIDCIQIPQYSEILFETNITEKSLIEVLELHSKNKTDFLALSFVLLSSYEEYLPYKNDKHARFSYKESKSFKTINILKPFIDNYAYHIKTEILKMDTNYIFPKKNAKIISTIDIDSSYNIKGKTPIQLWKKIIKNIFYFNLNEVKKIIKVSVFNEKDPYDVYEYIEQKCKENKVENIYFFLLGKSAKYDRNINANNTSQKKLIQSLSKNDAIGLHPSYLSNSEKELLRIEKSTLENIVAKKVTNSRQHYIKLKFPFTYERLIQYGIEKDFSMGFQDQIGFRAGTCHPFYFFNLKNNKETHLKIYPFVMMDVSLKNYMKYNIKQSIEAISVLKKEVQKVKGLFIPIFHNESLSDQKEWKNWRLVFEEALKDFENTDTLKPSNE